MRIYIQGVIETQLRDFLVQDTSIDISAIYFL